VHRLILPLVQITNRGATTRGEVRNRIRAYVQNTTDFGNFIHPARTSADIEHNIAQVTALVPLQFHYEVSNYLFPLYPV
jgi:hypothetical protein